MKRYIRANKLISCVPVETYKGYLITCCLYGEDYNTKGGYRLYCVDYDKRTIKFESLDEARAFIDELV